MDSRALAQLPLRQARTASIVEQLFAKALLGFRPARGANAHVAPVQSFYRVRAAMP